MPARRRLSSTSTRPRTGLSRRSAPSSTCPRSLALVAAADDQPLRALVVARLRALGRLAPGRDRVPPARGPPLAAAVRVVDRVHHHAPVVRAPAQPARPPGLANLLVHVVG